LGGLALLRGKIAEMRTGEGKTLVATLPATFHALGGKGVHVVTVNDYLARRDGAWMGQVYDYLGLSVGVVTSGGAYRYDASHVEKEATGDGNDGFSQAKLLQKGKVRTEVLDSNDLEDWYTFKVGASTSLNTVPGTQMIVNVVSSDKVGCIIYPLADVDLFGFSGPNCNEVYMYPQGTYMVNVRHGLPRASKQTYTLELK
jgi:hypothetical protein